LEAQTAAASAPQTHSFFDSYSKHYDLVNGLLSYRKLLWDAFEALELEPGMKILDAGCGTGNFEQFISEKNLPPVTIEAIDFSQGMLNVAGEKCSHLDYVSFDRGDLGRRLPYPDATFDRIVSINVLYAVPDWRATMQELVRVLKPGGKIIVTSTRVGWSYGPIFVDHFRRVGNIWGFSRKVGAVMTPLRWFSPRGLGSFISNVLVQDRLEKAGEFPSFSEEELRGFLETEASTESIEEFDVWPVFSDQNLMASVRKGPALQLN